MTITIIRSVKHKVCLLAALFILSIAFAAEPKTGEFPKESITVGRVVREYRLVVPKSVDFSKPSPLVFAFHGMGIDSKDLMPQYSKLNETAQKHQFILVYPAAEGKSWGLKPEKITSDLAFFDALLKDLVGKYQIDTNRIYVLGMSNGAYFANIVAKERSKQIAAMAGHSGGLDVKNLAAGVNANRKYPLIIVHGKEDKILPLKLALASKEKYEKEGHEVEYVEVPNLGHQWATKIDVNEKIWKFFADHPLNAKPKN